MDELTFILVVVLVAILSAGAGVRRHRSCMFGGVCCGYARYFGVSPLILQFAALIALFAYGSWACVAYLILWIAIPRR